MATQPEYFESFTQLQNELVGFFGDVSKKYDTKGVGKDFVDLQTKLITTTIDTLTASVKAYRETLK